MNNPIVPMIEYGSLAKIIRDIPADDHNHALHEGQLIEIEDYVSAEEADDGIPFYWASTHGTGNQNDVSVNADCVELVKTAEQMQARRIPTVTEIRDFLSSALLDDGEGFSVTETDRDGENGVEIAGQTDDGLRFAGTIRITSLFEADF